MNSRILFKNISYSIHWIFSLKFCKHKYQIFMLAKLDKIGIGNGSFLLLRFLVCYSSRVFLTPGRIIQWIKKVSVRSAVLPTNCSAVTEKNLVDFDIKTISNSPGTDSQNRNEIPTVHRKKHDNQLSLKSVGYAGTQ